MRRRIASLRPGVALLATFALLAGGCSSSEDEQLQDISEKVGSKKFMPLGQATTLLLPQLKARAKENPGDFKAQFELATAAIEAGELATALEAAERAVQLDNGSIPARELYAHALQKSGRVREAAAQWESIVASGKPYSPVVDSNLGNVYKLAGQFEEAERSYRKALAALEADETARTGLIAVNLADLQIQREKYAEALQTVQQALEANPNLIYAHHLLGRIAFARGDLQEAVRELAKEIEVRPTNWAAYYLLGLAYGRMDPPQLEKTEEAFAQLSALRPGEGAYFKALLADVYVDAGQLEKGKTLATEALAELAVFREDQRNAAYHALAKAYAKLGDEAKAREFQQKFQQTLDQTDRNDPEQRRRIREMDSLFGSG